MNTTKVESIPAVDRAEAAVLAATEYDRYLDQLRALGPDDWSKPTDCPLWDVRAVAGHSVGMMSDFTSLWAVMRRMVAATRAARKVGGEVVDSMTAQQVDELGALSPNELIDRGAEVGPRAARWRAHAPGLLRRIPTKQEVAGQVETWRIGYLLDTILTRDPWMHRIDIARATGREPVHTADHDGRIVADVVAEWARRHGLPFTLTLTGPAGGRFAGGAGPGDDITIDAVEFCRILSGRAPGTGLLAHEVPF